MATAKPKFKVKGIKKADFMALHIEAWLSTSWKNKTANAGTIFSSMIWCTVGSCRRTNGCIACQCRVVKEKSSAQQALRLHVVAYHARDKCIGQNHDLGSVPELVWWTKLESRSQQGKG